MMDSIEDLIYIRDATLEDVDSINMVVNSEGVLEYLPDSKDSQLERDIKKQQRIDPSKTPGPRVLVAEMNGIVVGYAHFSHLVKPDLKNFDYPELLAHSRQTTMHALAVHVDYRRKGVGKALFSAQCQDIMNHRETQKIQQPLLLFKSKIGCPARRFFMENGCHIIGYENDDKKNDRGKVAMMTWLNTLRA